MLRVMLPAPIRKRTRRVKGAVMKRLKGLRGGYTLLEMAIAMVVIGTIMGSAASAYNVYAKKQSVDTTSANIGLATEAVGNYLIQQGRYPCPARTDLDRSSPDYGMEGDCTDTASIAVGTCADGICVEESERLVGAGAGGFKDIIVPGATASSYYSNLYWTCAGGTPCNYYDWINYYYIDDPSVRCPNPGDKYELFSYKISWSGSTFSFVASPTKYDMCTASGFKGYYDYYTFNGSSLYAGWWGISTVAVGGGTAPRIRRGVIPFRALNIPEEFSEDGYNMKIAYAVTEHLAVTESYVKTEGGVSVVDGSGNSLVSPASSAHFIVFSHGPDRAGAWNRHGKQGVPCPTGTNDAENCDTLADDRATYMLADRSFASGADYFDDHVKYYTSVNTPLWKVADSSSFHVHDLIGAGAVGGGQIGIGQDDPQETIHVGGNILSEDDLMLTEICQTPADCFATDKISGNRPEMQCAPGTYMTGISGGAVNCAAVVEFKCPAGEMMTGINADGSLVCQTVVPCPATNVTICTTNDGALPGGLQGQMVTLTSGASRTVVYQCNAGVWQSINTTGVCNCTPVNQDTTIACDPNLDGGWTGNIIQNTTTVCPSGVTTISNNTSDCSCVPDSETRPVACAAGFVGGTIEQRDWVCDTATSGHWTAWVTTGGACTCNTSTETRNLTCPTAYTGTWQQERSFTCPAGTWTAWADTINTCGCSGSTQTQSVACGTGYVGTKTQQRTYNCPTNSWGAWVDTNTSGCYAVTYYWKDKTAGTASGSKGSGPEKGTVCSILGDTTPCWGYKSGGGYYNYPSCSCE